jgi:hypothetical protein
VGIGVEEPVPEQAGEGEAEDRLAPGVAELVRCAQRGLPTEAVDPRAREHTGRAQVGHDMGDANGALGRERSPEGLLVPCFSHIVDLVEHAGPDLVYQRLEVLGAHREAEHLADRPHEA